MKVVLQRVSRAAVRVGGELVAAIGPGLLLLAAVERADSDDDLQWCARKAAGARVFSDADGKMNLAVTEVGGEILAVSQFTLAGNLRRGRRPSFEMAAPPDRAEPAYQRFLASLAAHGVVVRTGVFGANMAVELVNDGPVTLILDSAERHEARSG
jgi:D-tyrosyl-tRNA(Tyr) deacylase